MLFRSYLDQELSIDERNLLSVAFKNRASTMKTALRFLQSIRSKEGSSYTANQLLLFDHMNAGMLNELHQHLRESVDVFLHLAGKPTDMRVKIGYLKFLADAEKMGREYSIDVRNETGEPYSKQVEQLANQHLGPLDPIRLGAALSRVVWMYEIEGNREEANRLGKKAFDEAIAALVDTEGSIFDDPDTYTEVTLLMSMLRDNLTLWNYDDEINDSPQ